MTNLQRLLQNPSTPDQTLKALVTALLEDEQILAAVAPAAPASKSVSASYEAQPTDGVIFYSGVMDGSQGITLPTADVALGKVITVKVTSADTGASALNVNTSNAAEYVGNPQLFTIPGGAAVGGIASLVWDGSAWWLLEYNQ
jgi:hypothetical protein